MDIFVKRPVISIVISLILLLAGVAAAFKIPVLQFPQIKSASLIISTQYTGSSAEVVQGFITEPIERVAMTVPGVDYVSSNTTAGQSTVTAWLNLNENSTAALAELTSRLSQISYELPEGAQDPSVTVQRADRPFAVFYLNVQADHWTRSQISDYITRQVNPLLAAIDGVQRVGLEGSRNPAMRIWIDPAKLSAVNMGADEVLEALRANNVIAAIGSTENDKQKVNILSNATLQTVEDFRKLILQKIDNSLIRLGDVATIELGEDRGDVGARLNQQQTMFISIWPLPGANEIEIGNAVYKKLKKINTSFPEGLKITIAYDGTTYMRNALKEIFITLFETVVLVGIAVLALMGSLRTALVPLITIPISILGSIAAMIIMGFTLNLLTVLAIVLSVGLVVDDAIVVVENVARHIRDGKTRLDAALISSRELLKPIIAMTFALAAVYGPIGFVGGLTGSLFKEFAFTLAIAVIISGIVAITLSPIMSSYVCSTNHNEPFMAQKVNNIFDRLRHGYMHALTHTFRWKNPILFAALFLSLLIIPFYIFSRKELAPVEDEDSISMIIEAPPGSSLAYTETHIEEVIDKLYHLSGITQIWQILTPEGGFAGLNLVNYKQRERSVQEMLPKVFSILSSATGLKVFPVLSPPLPTAGQFDVEMVVQSPDSYQEMEKYAQKLIQAAYASNMFMFVDTDLKINLPQIRLIFKHDRISDLGMNINAINLQLETLISEQYVNRFNNKGKAYRVIPTVKSYARDNPAPLLDLPIKTPSGELIPLRAIATMEHVTSPRIMGSFNQQRSFRIMGGVLPGTTSDQALTALEDVAQKILPATYTVDYAGISRQLRKEGNSMFSVLLIALCVSYLVLSIQFNSFRSPLVVLVGSVPLALTGAMLFSFLSFTTLNIYAQIGFVTLVGLIAKNGILITEFANELQNQGKSKTRAIKEAAQIRLRPVLMTTTATVLGHFPLVFVTGAGAEARNSIGIILVAGMLIGTLFTLFILPCVYLWLAGDKSMKSSKKWAVE